MRVFVTGAAGIGSRVVRASLGGHNVHAGARRHYLESGAASENTPTPPPPVGALSTAAGEGFEVSGDPGLLKAPEWDPRYSLSEGLRDTLARWEAQADKAVARTGER